MLFDRLPIVIKSGDVSIIFLISLTKVEPLVATISSTLTDWRWSLVWRWQNLRAWGSRTELLEETEREERRGEWVVR